MFSIMLEYINDISLRRDNDSTSKDHDKILSSGSISAFHKGLNQINLIAVVAEKSNIDVYVNLHLIASAGNSTYNQGQVGVLAKDDSNATEVVFRNAKVWTLSG